MLGIATISGITKYTDNSLWASARHIITPLTVIGGGGAVVPDEPLEFYTDEETAAFTIDLPCVVGGATVYAWQFPNGRVAEITVTAGETTTIDLKLNSDGVIININQTVVGDDLSTVNVGGVLSGNILNPGFAVNMAEQSELDNAISDLKGGVPPSGNTLNKLYAGKIETSAITNNLTETNAGKVLDARAGKVLRDLIDNSGGVPTDYALKFDRTKNHNVYGGRFWEVNEVYGDFYIDMLVNPTAFAEYPFSAGRGGLHNIIFGFSGGGNSFIGLTGNLSKADGSGVDISFDSGVDKVQSNGWCHIAAYRVNNYLILCINGVPCRRLQKTTGRMSNFDYETDIYIGGSDHSNFDGYIKYVRIFENASPLQSSGQLGNVFRPKIRPRGRYTNGNSEYFANLLYDFSTPSDIIADHSDGLNGHQHPAIRNFTSNDSQFGSHGNGNESLLPQWEKVVIERPTTVLTPKAVPVAALVFDSFQRNDVTYLFDDVLGLGSSEGGSAGVKVWENSNKYGILSGRAFSADTNAAPAFVTVGTKHVKAECRNAGNYTNGFELYLAWNTATNSGIYGYHDSNGYFIVYSVVEGALTSAGGVYLFDGSLTTPYKIAIEYTSNKHIKLYIDDVLKFDFDDSANAAAITGTKAGIKSPNGFVRFADFTVYAA